MKKTISLVLLVVMVLSSLVVAIPTNAAKATADNIDYVEARYFESAPTIDGYISTAEWGDPVAEVDVWDAATVSDKNAYSKFFYNRANAGETGDYGSFSYQVWLGWDLNKFYLGVKVKDPDTHALKKGTKETWDGDAVQTRIDFAGANAVFDGGTFEVTEGVKKPWKDANVPDFLFGYVQIAGGFTEAWENVSNKGMTSFSKNGLGVTDCVVAPAGSSYSPDTQAGYTTYEAAIPWAYITNAKYTALLPEQNGDGGRKGKENGAYGLELGMSLNVFNDGGDANVGWDAFLAWGSGVDNFQYAEGPSSCAGSNSVTLVEDAVVQGSYTKYDPTPLLDASFDNKNVDAPGVYYDYLAGDYYKETKLSYDQLSSLTYDDANDQAVWGSVTSYKGKITKLDGDSHGNVLDYRVADLNNVQTYLDTRDGTIEYRFPTSYTFEFDIMYTGVEQTAEGYESAIYNMFGTASAWTAYQCGYFFNDKAFKVVGAGDPSVAEEKARYPYDLKKGTWYNWKFQYDNESCNARLWIDDLSTEADNVEAGTAGTPGCTGPWGTLVINSRWRYYYYSNEVDLTDGTLLMFRQMNTQVAYDNVKIYNFASYGNIAAPSESSGATGGGNAGPIQGGGEIKVENAVKEDGVWNIPVYVTPQYLSATKLSFTVKFDAAKGEFQGVKGLAEGTYTTEKIADGEYVITITNFDAVKNLKSGDKYFDILIKSDADKIEDLGVTLKDAYTYQNTGDGMVFIIIATVVALLGCAIVIGKRRSMVR